MGDADRWQRMGGTRVQRVRTMLDEVSKWGEKVKEGCKSPYVHETQSLDSVRAGLESLKWKMSVMADLVDIALKVVEPDKVQRVVAAILPAEPEVPAS